MYAHLPGIDWVTYFHPVSITEQKREYEIVIASYLPALASEQGNVIRSVSVHIYIYVIKKKL